MLINGHEVWGFNFIALKYLKGFFLVDLLSSIPFDLIAAVTFTSKGAPTDYGSLSILKALKIPRLLRISKIFVAFDQMDLGVAVVWRISRLVLIVFFVVHCLCAIMGILLEMESSTNLHHYPHIESHHWYTRYVICFVACADAMFGYTLHPTTTAERLLQAFCIFTGVAVESGIIGSITMIIESVNESSMEYRRTMDVVNESLRYLKADDELTNDIRHFFDFSYGIYQSAKGPQHGWFDLLSPNLKARVLATKYTESIQRVPLFSKVPAHFIAALLPHLKTELHIPGELIITNGSMGKNMYFIVQGVCAAQVTNSQTNEVRILSVMKKGGFFGEIALLEDNCRRTCDVESVTYSDLSVLSKSSLETAFEMSPETKEFFLLVSRKRNENSGSLTPIPITDIIEEAFKELKMV
jgi:hypothetical protein